MLSFSDIRFFEKIQYYAESVLEGDGSEQDSRLGNFSYFSIPIGIIIWSIYTYFVVKWISSGLDDTKIFLVLIPYFLLFIYLLILLFNKKVVLVYTWKEFIYYPLILFILIIVLVSSYYVVSLFGTTGHMTLIKLIYGFILVVCAIWILYIAVRTVIVNKRHPFMGFLVALLKTSLFLVIAFWIYSTVKRRK